MSRCIDKANVMVRIFEEGLAGRHRVKDAFLALGPEAIVNAASFGDETYECFRFVGVELVEDEDPHGIGVRVDGAPDVRGEVLFRSSRPDGRQNRLSCRYFEVGDEAKRTVTAVLELDTLGLPGS